MATADIDIHTTVGRLVADRPSRARLFQQLGIDFCCGGRKPLADACRAKGLDPQAVLQTLVADEQADPPGAVDAAKLSLTELCDHIELTHHAYLRRELPRLDAMIVRVTDVHGVRCPWVRDVLTLQEVRDLTRWASDRRNPHPRLGRP